MLITETIEINAPAQTVYDVLVDFEQYSQWNPWIVKAQGSAEAGAIVDVWGKVGGKVSHFQHKVLANQPPLLFHWCDLGFFTHFAYGERKRELTEIEGKTQLSVELKVTGVFAFLADWLYGKSLRQGMAEEITALKLRAESQC
jgi:hypothetical protein